MHKGHGRAGRRSDCAANASPGSAGPPQSQATALAAATVASSAQPRPPTTRRHGRIPGAHAADSCTCARRPPLQSSLRRLPKAAPLVAPENSGQAMQGRAATAAAAAVLVAGMLLQPAATFGFPPAPALAASATRRACGAAGASRRRPQPGRGLAAVRASDGAEEPAMRKNPSLVRCFLCFLSGKVCGCVSGGANLRLAHGAVLRAPEALVPRMPLVTRHLSLACHLS